MRYISLTLASALLLFLIIFTGCGNQNSQFGVNSQEAQDTESSEISGKIPLKLNLKLMPGEKYYLNYENTGFKIIDWIYFDNCKELDKSLEIIGYADDLLMLINCSASNIALYSVEINNRSKKSIELTVYLTGNKKSLTK
ncbi:MAG: hypothetical protein HGGPFJEG_00955 [Ignavibacteria bacterium]|nr:hypothetical protein [Ignavibacteria bacterium]